MNETLKLIDNRSSIRKFTAELPTAEQLDIIAKAGLKAPTARNEQEVNISVITNQDLIAEINQKLAIYLGKEINFNYNSPVLFMLSGSKTFKWSALDGGIAVENMVLAANSLGLGNVVLGIIDGLMKSDAKLSAKCGIKEDDEFLIALAVGYPDTTKAQHNIDLNKITYIR